MSTVEDHSGKTTLVVLGCLLLGAMALPRTAIAQAVDAAASEALFQEGRRLMKAGDYQAACPKLEESLRLDPALGTLFNLASCEEQLGRWATAWEHWRQAADQLPTEDKRRSTAVARAAALEKVLPRLVITLAAGAPPDTEIQRDGVRFGVASLGLPIPVNPGRHTVTVSAPGRSSREFVAVLQAKDVRTLVVEPGAPRAVDEVASVAPGLAPSPPAELPADPGLVARTAATAAEAPGRSPFGYALLAGGVAALGAGGYFATQALAARKDAEKACPTGQRLCRVDAQDALDRDKRFSLLTDVGVGAGVALTGLGLYLLLRDPDPTPGDSVASVGLWSGGGAVTFRGRF